MNSSGRSAGRITVSCSACLAAAWPAISLKLQADPSSMISSMTTARNLLSALSALLRTLGTDGIELVRTR